MLEHFPHSGTHQMNGLVTPAEAAALPPEFQQGAGGIIPPYAPGAGEGMPPLPTEPAQLPALGNIITSGFEAQQGVQRRSGSGSHSQVGGAVLLARASQASCCLLACCARPSLCNRLAAACRGVQASAELQERACQPLVH